MNEGVMEFKDDAMMVMVEEGEAGGWKRGGIVIVVCSLSLSVGTLKLVVSTVIFLFYNRGINQSPSYNCSLSSCFPSPR
jgi:hypothetical protein